MNGNDEQMTLGDSPGESNPTNGDNDDGEYPWQQKRILCLLEGEQQ